MSDLRTRSPIRRSKLRPKPVTAATAALALLVAPATAAAQEGGHEHEHGHTHQEEGHHAGLHFSHPLVSESVSPDTKLRLDFNHRQLNEQEDETSFGLAAEYAFHRSMSLEVSVPYSATDEAFGFTHAALKFANYAFEEQGVSLGYGLGVEFPTAGDAPEEEGGHTHGALAAPASRQTPAPRLNGGGGVHGTLGEDFYEFEPFFNVGWKTGPWELVGFGTFGIPSGTGDRLEVGTELSWNFSALYRVMPEVQALLELNGTSGLSGAPVGEDVVNLSPGIKLRPSGGSHLFLGVGGSVPLSEDESFENRVFVSLFYHFF